MPGDDCLTMYDLDPYTELQKRHKMPYSYTFESVGGEDFLIRHLPRTIFFSGPDPQYVSLQSSEWTGEEFQLDDILPRYSIASCYSLRRCIFNKLGHVDLMDVKAFKTQENQENQENTDGSDDDFTRKLHNLQIKRKTPDSDSDSENSLYMVKRSRLHEELDRHRHLPSQ